MAVALFIAMPVFADRLDQMIAPGFHPTNFEDPRQVSELRLLYVLHGLDDKFVTAGGDVQVYALQARYAFNKQLSLIATKDGIIDFNPKATLPKKSGLADLEAGLKYTLAEDPSSYIFSGQLRYLIPVGDEDVLQGKGDGMIHPSVSLGYALTNEVTFTTGTGLRIPVDSDDSFFWDLDAQMDYRIDTSAGSVHPFVGFSLIHVADAGKRLPIADEGQDFFNFGASNADGESIVSGIGGLRFKPSSCIELGGSYQFPLNSGDGSRVLDYRWMFDAIYRF